MKLQAAGELLRRWQSALRLGQWQLRLRGLPRKSIAEDSEKTVWAQVSPDWSCWSAEIVCALRRKRRDLEADLVHELLHLHLWETHTVALAGFQHLPTDLREEFTRQLREAEERAVSLLETAVLDIARDNKEGT